ncbi:hypothetical protein [Massilia litorea]|jgi:hypothetical protein|uniref:Uncharacterized protein n=1 Tax=Massilia litorea TaxID=2769491 RepID=A0A7L9U1G1_9BURK|nr:hypothetical protein [Massilia litorea]QOL48834.1 hypothetical protein LPB04_18025 [Massilia litorea]
MEKLIAQLLRLYLVPGQLAPELLRQHLLGQVTLPLSLPAGGETRALILDFDKAKGDADGDHWTRLCAVAQALQADYGFPAPGVSISADAGFRLWLSFEVPVPAAEAQRFLEQLRDTAFPELAVAPDAVDRPVALPPCLDPASGRWSAFIHPGMGASFADEPGLEMAPPPLAQAAFLEQLETIGADQFNAALWSLQPAPVGAPLAPSEPAAQAASAPGELLLRDATLEDIVRHLHARNIEPTFRHLIPAHSPR